MRAFIVDDERMARLERRRLLAAHSDVDIAGEASNGDEALALLERSGPDVLFLDIQMPGMTGFDLLDRLRDVPAVIFTTAYDEYALKAFEVNALDYLLKPVAAARLGAALERVRRHPVPRSLEQIFLRDGDRCWIVKTLEIDLLESEGNYTRVFFRNEHPLISGSLAAFESRLPPASFFRASRRHVMNLNAIERTELDPAGNLLATLRAGQTVTLSRRQSLRLRDLLSV